MYSSLAIAIAILLTGLYSLATNRYIDKAVFVKPSMTKLTDI